ncbi:response regulator [Teichococcus aestuarii]|uniref:response regulator n=2 Tax=Teichococcus aestuarii TaxID=568898 RepID=UPI00362079F6
MTQTPNSGCKPDLDGTRILVAEDEAVIAMMVEDSLIGAGALVLGPVISVQDALQMVKVAMADGGITAAVLDIQLGDAKAIGVADVLRERGVPFLFATGYDGHPVLDSHRGVPVLCKPYNPEDLVRMIGELCHARAPAALAGLAGPG